jgi:hypothetical protein
MGEGAHRDCAPDQTRDSGPHARAHLPTKVARM